MRAAYFLEMTTAMLKESKEKDVVKLNELFSPEVQKMVKYHLIYIMFLFTRSSTSKFNFKDKRIKEIINIVMQVFALK